MNLSPKLLQTFSIKGVSIMKAIRYIFVCILFFTFTAICVAQQDGGSNTSQLTGLGVNTYQIGPGDLLTITILGEQQMDGIYEVNSEGFLEFPFVDNPIPAKCRTDKDVRKDLIEALKKYYRTPQVSLRVSERRSRPPAVIYGAVKQPQQFILNRRVRLVEVLSWAGGTEEGAAGSLQILHTTPVMCPAEGEEDLAKMQINKGEYIPSQNYNIDDVRIGKAEANPYVYPGDIVIVPKAPPIYIGGLVANPTGLYWSADLTLTKAIAMVGGARKDAKTEKIVVRRLKPGSSTEREVIAVNLKQLQKEGKDFSLSPYDVVEIDESSPWSGGRIGKTLLDLVTGGATSMVTGLGQLPTRVIY